MFTGIVTHIGTIIGIGQRNDVRRVSVAAEMDPESIPIGASIACAGICLTVVERQGADGQCVFEVDAAPETLDATTASEWDIGRRINLERSLKLGEEMSGHLVTGHIDGVATVVDREDLGESTRFIFEIPEHLARFVAAKGSVALDGTSLTVNKVGGARFEALLIPHSLQVTTWNDRKVGDRVNLEVDLIARYVARLQEAG